jgi:sec-independent protein translocase protein TatA
VPGTFRENPAILGFMGNISIWEILLLLLVLLLVFGPKRLPEMGRSLGRGMREFKDSITGKGKDEDEDEHEEAEQAALAAATAAPAAAAAAAPVVEASPAPAPESQQASNTAS